MSRISTYVFLDLEATGLPREENNRTKITEISVIAVKVQHLLECKVGEEPRVQHKLTLCFNPGRLIHPESTKITGLCNDLLEYEPMFNAKTITLLQSFFDLLTKPICLIAHNGFGFDYPLLRNHLDKFSMSFDTELLCSDSLYAFHDIIEKVPQLEVTETDSSTSSLIIQEFNESTPKKQKIKLKSSEKVKRKLFWSGGKRPTRSFKLIDIYKHLMKMDPEICHRADIDTSLIIKCAVAVSKEFVAWVEKNHCLFNEVKPMAIGVPFGN